MCENKYILYIIYNKMRLGSF